MSSPSKREGRYINGTYRYVRARALAIGRQVARAVFAKRGNHREAHLTEAELAALLALAAQLGAQQKDTA